MNNTDRTVLVTGATGRQGGSVIRHMAKGWKLRALTRKPDSAAGRELASRGIEVVAGDMEEAGTLGPALRGAYGVFSVQDFWAVGAKREVQQGKNLADAAKQAMDTIRADKPYQTIATEDIGAFAALALSRPRHRPLGE